MLQCGNGVNALCTRQWIIISNIKPSGDGGSLTTAFTYDKNERLICEETTIQKDSKTKTEKYKYDYDNVGNRTLKRINGNETVYSYNERNQLVQEKSGEVSVDYQYDPNGNLISKSNGLKNISYSYDALDRLTGYDDGVISYT